MAEIIVTFDEDGNPAIEVKGETGRSCEKLTDDLEKSLGSPGRRRRKDEYYHVAGTGSKKTAEAGK